MIDIPDIEVGTRNINVREIPDLPKYLTSSPPTAIPVYPPVTQQVGVPIIDMPGCVEAHEVNSDNNFQINEDDPKGVQTYCDAGVPAYTPIDYNKDKLKFETGPVKPPKLKTPEPPVPEAPTPEIPATPAQTAQIKCPTREQELKNPIGKILEGNKKITGYELVGKECLMVTENLNIPDQIIQNIPNAGMVTTTASIAVVATTSALLAKPLADLLLKVVKPTVKKVVKKIAAIRGKTPKVLSQREKIVEQRGRNQAIKTLRLKG
jgi:hypothetical protein|tara:strand:- start:585 stop:1376 length:792 start_codon:yes stop_codon:yes gene_type:complete